MILARLYYRISIDTNIAQYGLDMFLKSFIWAYEYAIAILGREEDFLAFQALS